MKRELKLTNDGSHTLFVPDLDEHYHSVHGAIQEALHVFIKHGFQSKNDEPIHILEIGFGTGLNAWLTAIFAEKECRKTQYTGIEKYPIYADEINAVNYTAQFEAENGALLFHEIHQSNWGEFQKIHPNFFLRKIESDFLALDFKIEFDLIYFDAFAPNKQPHLWTENIFEIMFSALKPGGFLVTYCAQGQVKRNMKAAGFLVEKLPGPPGKREMTKATKPTI